MPDGKGVALGQALGLGLALAAGARGGGGAGAWCRATSGVAEKNMDRNRIAEQRLVNRDGPHNHGPNGRRARIIEDRAVECWVNN